MQSWSNKFPSFLCQNMGSKRYSLWRLLIFPHIFIFKKVEYLTLNYICLRTTLWKLPRHYLLQKYIIQILIIWGGFAWIFWRKIGVLHCRYPKFYFLFNLCYLLQILMIHWITRRLKDGKMMKKALWKLVFLFYFILLFNAFFFLLAREYTKKYASGWFFYENKKKLFFFIAILL